ncbi:hypothetical protein ADK55_19160 [Streptomyces sp. WM4235]|uniref:hypothetical protein n=1 Tax=Streptomyces sp. WM4235 TaxID=1415551 RepID=UPI0006AED4AE|nr:hypothetical protein [Streptomyces sp. WM4235]KOU48988.1 hypothetical protein ADK55_19160 [Streptomyces sp. WM4235]
MTPTEARETLDTARTEAAQAHETIEALAERVRAGDEHVTAEQIAGQRQLAELAELRVEAAERKLAAAVAADRDARANAIGAAVRELVNEDDTQPLIEAVQAAVAALEHLVRLDAARTARIHAVARDVVAINEELKQVDPAAGSWPSDAYDFRGQTFPASVTALREGRTAAVPPGRLAAVALALALTSDRQMEADARETLKATTDAVVVRVTGEVPGLAAALRVSPEEWQAASVETRYRLRQQGRNPIEQQERAA